MTRAERIVSILLEDSAHIRGEYWITDSDVWFADGDIGEMNHEGYVVDICVRKILDLFAADSDEEYYDGDMFRDAIIEALNEDGVAADETNWEELADQYIRTHVRPEELEQKLEEFATARGMGDARTTAVKYWGWIWVRHNDASIWTFTQDDRQNLASGFSEIAMQEGIEGPDLDNLEIDIHIASTGRRVSMTIAELESGRTPNVDPTWPGQIPEAEEQPQLPLDDPYRADDKTLHDVTNYALINWLKPGDEAIRATSIPKDIIEACLELLRNVHPAGYDEFVATYSDEIALLNQTLEDDTQLMEFQEKVFDKLQKYCPPYTYFGFYEADGSVGCWPNEVLLGEAAEDGVVGYNDWRPDTEYTYFDKSSDGRHRLYKTATRELVWEF